MKDFHSQLVLLLLSILLLIVRGSLCQPIAQPISQSIERPTQPTQPTQLARPVLQGLPHDLPQECLQGCLEGGCLDRGCLGEGLEVCPYPHLHLGLQPRL
jgi:hypothetical protein